MADEVELNGMVIGNIIVVDDSGSSGQLVAYRQIGGVNTQVAAFPLTDQGLVTATLFAAYLAQLFPDGEISQEALQMRDIPVEQPLTEDEKNAIALTEVNRLGLFGQDMAFATPNAAQQILNGNVPLHG